MLKCAKWWRRCVTLCRSLSTNLEDDLYRWLAIITICYREGQGRTSFNLYFVGLDGSDLENIITVVTVGPNVKFPLGILPSNELVEHSSAVPPIRKLDVPVIRNIAIKQHIMMMFWGGNSAHGHRTECLSNFLAIRINDILLSHQPNNPIFAFNQREAEACS